MSAQPDPQAAPGGRDSDSQETREWTDALSAVIESQGSERAHFLLEQLLEHARQSSVDMPFSANTGYVNTIEPSQEARSPGGAEHPVWLLSQLRVLRPSPAHADDLYVRATATNLAGPVVGSRITFSRGLHMSCFGTTDTRGQVQCKLLDTHPHGPGSEGTHQEHAGPLVVTLAGTADSHRIQLPAVVIQTEKGHKAAKNH